MIKFSTHWLNTAPLPTALISTWLNNYQGLMQQWNLTFKLIKGNTHYYYSLNQYRILKTLITQNPNRNGKPFGKPHFLIFKLAIYHCKHLRVKIGSYTMNHWLSYSRSFWKSQFLFQHCHCSKYFWSFSFIRIFKIALDIYRCVSFSS